MSQQHAEMSPPPVHSPDQCRPSTPARGIPSLAHTAIDPPTGAVAPGNPPKPHKGLWKRHFVPRSPVLLMYLALLLITAFLFVAAVSNSGDHYAADQLSPNKNGVAILGDVTEFDELDTKGQLTVTWLVVGCGEYGPQTAGENPDGYSPVDRAVDVYLDDPLQPAFSYDPTQLPVAKTGEKFGPRRLVSFDTEHRIETGGQYNNPLNLYSFVAFVFVVERATNKSVPVTAFAVGDVGPADLTTISVEVPTTNQFTYQADGGQNTVEVESRTIFARVEYSTRARALTFTMFMINWILTLCSVAIALVVFSRRGKVKDGIALLPVTIILSTPAIRGLYVGSPPFGIFLDVVGFFPQMLTVLVSTLVVLSVLATPQPIRDGGIVLEKGVITIESHAGPPAAA